MNQSNSMVSLQSLVANAKSNVIGVDSIAQRQIPELAEQIINSAFEKLSVLFPVGKPKPEQLALVKSEWVKTLAANQVSTVEQIQTGLNRARLDCGDRQFWPSPLQFAKWCKASPESIGLPSDESAYREALKHYHHADKYSWSHQIVYLAVRETSTWVFSNAKEREVREVFFRNYSVLVKRFMAGENLDFSIPKALPSSVSIPTKPAAALNFIAEIKSKYRFGGVA